MIGVPTDPAELVAFIIDLTMTLGEEDQAKVRAGIVSNKAESDALTDDSRRRDTPKQ